MAYKYKTIKDLFIVIVQTMFLLTCFILVLVLSFWAIHWASPKYEIICSGTLEENIYLCVKH